MSGPADQPTRPERVHRADIEGLRALAIALVAVYHVWGQGRVSGGVDIFLMISGFFVGGSLVRRAAAGAPPVLRTYLPRLARRLVPALAVTLAGVVVGAWLFFPRSMWSGVSSGVLASLGYVENWRMALAGQAYGAADPLSSPVQHIWSLSAQGQIFVGLAVLLAGLAALQRARLRRAEGRAGRSGFVGRHGTGRHGTGRRGTDVARRQPRPCALSLLVLGLTVASFAYATWGVAINQDFAYYDTGARLWEFLVGTLLALALARWSLPRWLQVPAGLLGLALVLATGVLVDGRAAFPGVAALVPIGGAALLVAAGGGGVIAAGDGGPEGPRGVNRVLAWRPIARAGAYAYEFYLWHWVVLVFALAAFERAWLGWLAGSVVLGVSAVLAWVTHIVLAPLREATPRSEASPRREATPRSEATPHSEATARSEATPQSQTPRSRASRRSRAQASPRARRAPSPARTRYASQARLLTASALVLALLAPVAWLTQRALSPTTALASVDETRHPGALTLLDADAWPTVTGVPFVPGVLDAFDDWPLRGREECSAAGPRETALHTCELGDPAGAVTVALVGGSHSANFAEPLDIVAARSGVRVVAYLKEGCPLLRFSERAEDPQLFSCDVWNRALAEELRRSGVTAVLTTGTRPGIEIPGWPDGDWVPPWYLDGWRRLNAAGVPVVVIRDNPWLPLSAPECVEEFGPFAPECVAERAAVLGANPLDDLDDEPLLATIDLSDSFCDDAVCQPVVGNVLVYLDSNHVTATYARTIAPALEEALINVAWWP